MVTAARVGNAELHRRVLTELEFDPAVDPGKIGIAVEDGVVTLTGTVGSFSEKWATERAVKHVPGVRALANELKVELMGMHRVNDSDIAASAANVLSWDDSLPKTIQVEVHDGIVTLTGQVEYAFQADLAERQVWQIAGVGSVNNELAVKSH
jgi:osmotically-inducible protein OsmY